MKNKWTLTPDAFSRLLAWLSPNREEAAQKYEEIRQKLISYFTRRGHPGPEELADETFDRAARRLESGTLNYSGDPVRDLTGFAHYVWMEDLRRLRPDPLENADILPSPDRLNMEVLFLCLDRCMASLTGHSRDILTRYHQEKGHEKSVLRQLLADEAGVSLATLRIRVCRMIKPVRECFFACIEKESAN
jgi:DNA-directed RNA polymerase specialized sigma24 family protein